MEPQDLPRFAGFWARFIACVIDSTILTIVSTLAQVILVGIVFLGKGLVQGWGNLPGFWELAFSNALWAQILNGVLYFGFSLAYYGIGVARYQTTLGKGLFRMRVVRAESCERLTMKRALGRQCASIVSLLPFGAGYLMALFHPRKQALHDAIAGTWVIADEKPVKPKFN